MFLQLVVAAYTTLVSRKQSMKIDPELNMLLDSEHESLAITC